MVFGLPSRKQTLYLRLSAGSGHVILQFRVAALTRAMSAAIKDGTGLKAMAQDPDSAMFASRCQLVDRALETIELMPFAVENHLKGAFIDVPTGFAFLIHHEA